MRDGKVIETVNIEILADINIENNWMNDKEMIGLIKKHRHKKNDKKYYDSRNRVIRNRNTENRDKWILNIIVIQMDYHEIANSDIITVIKKIIRLIVETKKGYKEKKKDKDIIRMLKIKKRYEESIRTMIDKDSNRAIVICKKRYWNMIYETIFQDELHYRRVKKKESEIKRELIDTMREKKWIRLGRYRYEGRIPTNYLLPKKKDKNRIRPVMAGPNGVDRAVTKRVQKILTYMLKESNWEHKTIWKTNEVRPNIEKRNIEMYKQYGKNTIKETIIFDIKNFFTEVDIEKLKKSVRRLIKTYKNSRNRGYISIRRTDGIIYNGKIKYDRNWITVKTDMIIEIVEYKLDNGYFRIGSEILKQIRGLFMG